MSGYDLRRPCPHCPFRIDVPAYLRPERCVEITRSIVNGAEFPCHKTTVTIEDDTGEEYLDAGPDSQWCAGALIVMAKTDLNQQARIAERLGVFDPDRLDMAAPVVEDFSAFIRHHGGEEEGEPCDVADGGCLAPAGWMEGGGLVTNHVAPGLTESCGVCGAYTCEACRGRCCDDADA